MGKTDTIKDRRVDVYVDTINRKERWSRIADEEDESLSQFVQQCVEYAIEKGGPDFTELGEESKQIQALEEDELDEELVTSWIKQAAELPGEQLF